MKESSLKKLQVFPCPSSPVFGEQQEKPRVPQGSHRTWNTPVHFPGEVWNFFISMNNLCALHCYPLKPFPSWEKGILLLPYQLMTNEEWISKLLRCFVLSAMSAAGTNVSPSSFLMVFHQAVPNTLHIAYCLGFYEGKKNKLSLQVLISNCCSELSLFLLHNRAFCPQFSICLLSIFHLKTQLGQKNPTQSFNSKINLEIKGLT